MTDELDPGIASTVRCLNANGFRTIGSCEGRSGHAFDFPTVQIASNNLSSTRRTLCRFLLGCGVKGFSIKEIYMYQGREKPECHSYVEVEFWSKDMSWADDR